MKYNLSEITEVIKERRSIPPEKFTDRKVHREVVEHVLNNGIWAPTHGMTQPWHFVVFMDKGSQDLAAFIAAHYRSNTPEAQFLQPKYDKYMKRGELASVAIAICMKRQDIEKIPEVEEVEAVACAVQNMHLTCTAYGLGAFWSSGGAIYSDEMKDFLGLGEKDRCLGIFYIGYPAEDWPRGQRTPLEYKSEWRDG